MLRFLIRRLMLGLLVMILVTMFVFFIFFVLDSSGPLSVAHRLAGKEATQKTVMLIEQRLHLNAPVYKQYWYFLFGEPHDPLDPGLIHGSLGYDYYNQVPVTTTLKQAFPITLSLAIGASILWVTMGVLSGVISAVRPRSIWDRMFTLLALFFYSMPTFVLGLLFLLVLYYDLTKAGLTIFPAGSYVPITQNPAQWAQHLILPWFTLALVSAAAYTRLTRGSMLDVLGEDYIRTARAKGLRERRVIFRHGLRAGLTPIVTQFGIDLGVLIGGAIITENVFSLPGLGYLAVQSITTEDLPVIIGITILASAAVVVANIVVDIVYAVLDPRVRLN